MQVARVIALAYLGEKSAGMEINHKDGDRLNNRPENLEYVTPIENVAHAGRLGLRNTLTPKQVEEIRRECQPGVVGKGMKAMGRRYGVAPGTIRSVLRGRTWQWLQ